MTFLETIFQRLQNAPNSIVVGEIRDGAAQPVATASTRPASIICLGIGSWPFRKTSSGGVGRHARIKTLDNAHGVLDFGHRVAQHSATPGGTVEVFRTIIAQHHLGLPRPDYPGRKAFLQQGRPAA